MLRTWSRPLVALVALVLAACVLPAFNAPGPGQVDEATVTALKSRTLSRTEILFLIGEPDLRHLEDRVFVYRWAESLAVVVVGGYYQAGGFSIDEQRRLMIEFDSGGMTRRVEVIHALGQSTLDKAVQAWLSQVTVPAR